MKFIHVLEILRNIVGSFLEFWKVSAPCCNELKYSIAFLESAGCAEFMRVTGREFHLISAFAMEDASLWQQDFRENLMVCKMCLNFAARFRGVVDHLPWLMIHNIKPTDHDSYHVKGFQDCSMHSWNKWVLEMSTWVETPCSSDSGQRKRKWGALPFCSEV